MNLLANFISILSLTCGFGSIIFALEKHFTFSSWAIILSVIFDGLDGQVARRNATPSEFGRELDSLVDVVSFGIAPSVLGYVFVYHNFYLGTTLVLFGYLFCSVMRLARYNVTAKEKSGNYFYGLPTTASGGVLASFILLFRKNTQLPPPSIFLLIVICLSGLMVSKVRYPNLDGLRQIAGNKTILFFVIILIVFCFMPEITIFGLFLFYLLLFPFLMKKIV